jgi:hypothetical protein
LGQEISLSQKKNKGKKKMTAQTDSGAQTASCSMGSGVSSKDKAAAVEVEHSQPSNAEVKNEWS